MLLYAVKLTLTPGDMTLSDINGLRDAGFADRDILDIVEVTAYYAYANRIADGCLLYTSPSPRDATLSRMPSSA